MDIRRIYLDDHQVVIPLFDQYRVFYKQESDIALAERFIKTRLENNESVIFAAFVSSDAGESAAGFTQLYPKYSSARAVKNWILNDLYVEPAFRGHGIAQGLIDAAIGFAKADGAKSVQLETGVENYRAQRLYEFVGFVPQEPGSDFLMYRINVG